jgi:hypothetical protein
MANRANFADLLTPGFRKIYNDRYNEVPLTAEKVFHVNTSDKADEKDTSMSGFGLAQVTAENGSVVYEDPVQGYDTTYSHLKYTKGFKITLEMYEDDLYNIMNKRPAALARCMRRTSEYYAAQMFNNAFSTSQLGADGKPLFSTTHPSSAGLSSQSNASSTSITLTEDNLETGRLAMRTQLDPKGQIIDVAADTLVVSAQGSLEKTAHLIIDSTMRQGTADNDMNFYKNKFNIISWIYLTSTTAWYLLDSSTHELNWFWRRRPQFKDDELFDTEVAVYKSSMRFSRLWSDWVGVWGSKGDATAFSS